MELTTYNQNITTRESIRATKRDLISVPYLSLSNASGLGTTILKQTPALVRKENLNMKMLGCWSDSSSFNRFGEKKTVTDNKKETPCYTARVRELQTREWWLMPALFSGGMGWGSKWSIRAPSNYYS